MTKRYDRAAVLYAHDYLSGNAKKFELHYNHGIPSVGITNVNPDTNRITFAPDIKKVTIADTGNTTMVKRRLPFCPPIEVGIPAASPTPIRESEFTLKTQMENQRPFMAWNHNILPQLLIKEIFV